MAFFLMDSQHPQTSLEILPASYAPADMWGKPVPHNIGLSFTL